jgi:hypothetical protein
MGAVYLPLESQRRLIGLSRMALEEVVYGAKSQLSLLTSAAASFRSRVRFELEVITPSQNLRRSIGRSASFTLTQISFPPLSRWG